MIQKSLIKVHITQKYKHMTYLQDILIFQQFLAVIMQIHPIKLSLMAVKYFHFFKFVWKYFIVFVLKTFRYL